MDHLSGEVIAALIGAVVWIGGCGVAIITYLKHCWETMTRLETVVSGCQGALIRAEKFESEQRKENKNLWESHGRFSQKIDDKLDQHITDDNHNFRLIQASVAEVKNLILRPEH